jgi:hypothetical protein
VIRLELIVAGFVGGIITAGLVVVAAQAGQTQAPTVEQMRKAVADEFPLPDGVKSELGS